MQVNNGLVVVDAPRLEVTSCLSREAVLAEIQRRLTADKRTLQDAIRQRELYFRVSVVGNCNLSCQFCHNEGAPVRGQLSLRLAECAVATAVQLGFNRVQFTGGEPLLRPDIAEFVAMARRHVDDVGITTNGTFLPRTLDSITEAGIKRIHISLQEESLMAAGLAGHWGIPEWLAPTIEAAERGMFSLRLNLPVPANCFEQAGAFLRLLSCSIKVFSVLPEGQSRETEYPLALLEDLVAQVNAERRVTGVIGEVMVRGYRPPDGIRCPTCADRARCKEQSHSLRLGADLMLRPCLATRAWDGFLDEDNLEGSIREAAMLALDYAWE